MDHAVSLVQAYLQLNGYFTSAEFPVFAGAGRNGARAITDIDILAFRFPTGLPLLQHKRSPQGLDMRDVDPGLGVAPDSVDMLIGEVKEGRVGINSGIRDPQVLKTVIGRLGNTDEEDDFVVHELLRAGNARLPSSGYVVRLVAFGAFPPGSQVPPCRIISLGHVLQFLQAYVRKHWSMLRHLQFKDPAFGFLMTLEKARRGGAGRRGEEGVEVVPAVGEERVAKPRRSAPRPHGRSKRRR
ncbi:MAG TPA: hypothetical protein VM779_02950 [Thermoanaerobaculia bacterium]|nr:hypothetical protein [Thermoanaerobaculia bacterium]